MLLLFLSFVAFISVVSCSHEQRRAHELAKHIVDTHYRKHHKGWRYEAPHVKPPMPHLDKDGQVINLHDISDHHKAPKNMSFPKNLVWLLQSYSQGLGIPLSYSDWLPTVPPTSYWATETYLRIGAIDPYGNPQSLDSAIAVQERTLTRWGLNLYDGATWEIALALWDLHEVAWTYERTILYTSTTGPMGRDKGAPGGIIDIRADHDDFKFGESKASGSSLKKIKCPGNSTHFDQMADGGPAKQPVKEMPGAFYYRMIGPKYEMIDPYTGNYVASFKIPWPNNDTTTPWNVYGEIHFNDWKPITGENVWSSIIGPLQTLYLATDGNMTNTTCGSPDANPKVPCDWKTWDTTPAPVQQAISILPAFKALLSSLGAIYHCPWGSKIFPYDPAEGVNVSNENNNSAYAALMMLDLVLKNYTNNTSDELITYARQTVGELLQGLDQWWDKNLLSEKDKLPDGSQVVPQGGHVINGQYLPVPTGEFGGLAVDCQTWGMTVLGAPRIDRLYGNRKAYNIWQATKKWAGYWKNGTNGQKIIAGVGYSYTTNVDSKTKNATIQPNNDIWSAEWTFGAINMAQVLSDEYKALGDAEAAQSLLEDAQNMYNEVTKLWDPTDKDKSGLMFPDGSYVYANARFFIPWGWYSNPISALCSTAWSVMQDRNFNPFVLGGGDKTPLKPPAHLYDLYYTHSNAE